MPTDIAEYLKAARKKELDAYIGTPTIDHTVEIIRTEIEIGRAVFETAGDTVPRAPFVRTSAANCTPQPMTETLSIQISESQTTSWSFSCEASLSETAEFTIGGDLIVAGASAKASVTVGVKVSTQVSSSSTKQVALTDSVTVTVPPKKRAVLRGQTWSTPIRGRASGHIVVRYWHQYWLDHTWPISNTQSPKVQTSTRIPFTVNFTSELITFTKVAREEDVDCDRIGLLIPGEEGFGAGSNHPMYASALWPADVFPPAGAASLSIARTGETSVPSGGPAGGTTEIGGPVTEQPPGWTPQPMPIEADVAALAPEDRAALTTVLSLARNSADAVELSRKLGWGEADLTTAKYVLKRAHEGIDVETAAREGIVRTALLHTLRNV